MVILQSTTAHKDVIIVQKYNTTGADVDRTKEVHKPRVIETGHRSNLRNCKSALTFIFSRTIDISSHAHRSTYSKLVFCFIRSLFPPLTILESLTAHLPDSFMHSSPMNSALADVHQRLQGPGGRLVPPPAYSAYPVQNVSLHAPHGCGRQFSTHPREFPPKQHFP